MKLLSWNIKRAGRRTRDDVVRALEQHAPDVAVLVDPPVGQRYDRLVEALDDIGLCVVAPDCGDEPPRVIIASRVRVRRTPPSARELELRNRWVEVLVPDHDLRVAGVYVPVTGKQFERKARMWSHVHEAARIRRTEPYVIVGDWNCGDHPQDKTHPGRPFKFVPHYREMLAGGFVEAWRHLNPDAAEFSWYRHDGRGFRIDHAFVSPALVPRVRAARYSHGERLAGTSDHSALLLEIG